MSTQDIIETRDVNVENIEYNISRTQKNIEILLKDMNDFIKLIDEKDKQNGTKDSIITDY